MKKLLLILLSALSLTAFAQEKKTIAIQQPQGDNAMVAKLVMSQLITAFASSEEWQPIDRSPEMLMKMSPEELSKLQPAQYILITELKEMDGMCFISCQIMNLETGAAEASAMKMTEPSPQSILQASTSLANQLLEK